MSSVSLLLPLFSGGSTLLSSPLILRTVKTNNANPNRAQCNLPRHVLISIIAQNFLDGAVRKSDAMVGGKEKIGFCFYAMVVAVVSHED